MWDVLQKPYHTDPSRQTYALELCALPIIKIIQILQTPLGKHDLDGTDHKRQGPF